MTYKDKGSYESSPPCTSFSFALYLVLTPPKLTPPIFTPPHSLPTGVAEQNACSALMSFFLTIADFCLAIVVVSNSSGPSGVMRERERGREGERERGSEGMRERGSEGARERERGEETATLPDHEE